MKWGYWNGYSHGVDAARAESLADFERVLAVLREEVSDLRRDRDNQLARADAAADLLLQHIGSRAISLAGKQEEVERTERQIKNTQALTQMGDPTEDLPYGDPRGLFKSKSDASIFSDLGEDVTTSEG